ncbi:MAG: hypothetical protein FJ088_09885, partial [Deltaproteobacteria bacterium]|nr:hypothetical protein [Deltaproteobacteria bacterium]
ACALLLAVTGAYFSGVYSIIFGGKKQPVVIVNGENQKRAMEIFLKARHEQYNGKIDAAISLLRQCTDVDPAFSEAYKQLGNIYASRGDQLNAAKNYRKYLDLSPNAQDAESIRGIVRNLEEKR